MKTTADIFCDELEKEKAIHLLKTYFAKELENRLGLVRTEAPLLVLRGTGVNDDLNGTERPVLVNVPDLGGEQAEIVHSLAKWKREKLARLQLPPGQGIYTDMRALRPDETVSELHSVYVDQWDWEKTILESNRSFTYLEKTVREIYSAIRATEKLLSARYASLHPFLPPEISFIHAEDLRLMLPGLSPKERENEIARRKGAVFITGIGGELGDGTIHDGRAPDYDDWSSPVSPGRKGLNGDIVVWNPELKKAFEISSMGIRVDASALRHQLALCGQQKRLAYAWHRRLLAGELPLSIGGGIGQSRLAMLLLRRKHIGEVQCSVWPSSLRKQTEQESLQLL